jgi:hypothetical protein
MKSVTRILALLLIAAIAAATLSSCGLVGSIGIGLLTGGEFEGLFGGIFGDDGPHLEYELADGGEGYIVVGCDYYEYIVEIPESYEGKPVVGIEAYAFEFCHNLKSVTIPYTVEYIGSEAFFGCYSLIEVVNNSYLNINLGEYENGCVALYAISVHSGESKIEEYENGYLFFTEYDGVNYLVGKNNEPERLHLPDSYKGYLYSIYSHAFYNYRNVVEVVIPDSVIAIGQGAFGSCSNLEAVNFEHNSSLMSIGADAFYGCSNLEEIDIPERVFSIGTGAFRKTGLVEVCFENKNGWNCFRDLDGEISIPEESLYDYNNAAELLKDRLCDGYWFCIK